MTQLAATPATFAATVKAAQSGDTITLGPGDYGAAEIRSRDFSPAGLTIDASEPRAAFATLVVAGVKHLTLKAPTVFPPRNAIDSTKAVSILTCSYVELLAPDIRGARDADGIPHGHALVFTGGDHNAVRGGEIAYFFKGVTNSGSDFLTVEGVDVHHIRTSPIDGGGQHFTVDNNDIHDLLFVVPTDHHDGIHVFTGDATVNLDGLTITNNRLIGSSVGGAEGINLQGTAQSGFTNFKVNSNTLRWNNNQGIATNFLISGEIRDNDLGPAPGLDDPKHAPTVILRTYDPAQLVITGNTLKDTPSLKNYRQNTFLNAAQIARMGAAAPVPPPIPVDPNLAVIAGLRAQLAQVQQAAAASQEAAAGAEGELEALKTWADGVRAAVAALGIAQ